MKLVVLSLAVEDLKEIRAFIAEDNPDAAQKVAQRLKESLQRLRSFPNLGKPGRVFGTRELVTPKIGKASYVIVYRVKDDRLEILRVVPPMRDIDQILLENPDELAP